MRKLQFLIKKRKKNSAPYSSIFGHQNSGSRLDPDSLEMLDAKHLLNVCRFQRVPLPVAQPRVRDILRGCVLPSRAEGAHKAARSGCHILQTILYQQKNVRNLK
jgi:hypothetical protein